MVRGGHYDPEGRRREEDYGMLYTVGGAEQNDIALLDPASVQPTRYSSHILYDVIVGIASPTDRINLS